jgi:hypothetical protein
LTYKASLYISEVFLINLFVMLEPCFNPLDAKMILMLHLIVCLYLYFLPEFLSCLLENLLVPFFQLFFEILIIFACLRQVSMGLLQTPLNTVYLFVKFVPFLLKVADSSLIIMLSVEHYIVLFLNIFAFFMLFSEFLNLKMKH